MLLTPALRRAAAELIGTAGLVMTVVGSGIMATRLTGDVAVQLLVNALATVCALAVLIWALGPISGAHLNPVVTLVAAARREMNAGEAVRCVLAQCLGGLAGTAIGNLMFELPAWHAATRTRSSAGLWLGEIVATAGLISLIGALTRTGHGRLGPLLVPAWIGAAYLFTSSTSFANPAVTLARSATDTFSGIALGSVPAFVAAQLVGAAIGAALTELFHPRSARPGPSELMGEDLLAAGAAGHRPVP